MVEVNVNQVSQEQLTELEHVGPVLAERIVNHRESEGQFNELSDLKNVKGIGTKLFSDIKTENNLNLDTTAVDNNQEDTESNTEEIEKSNIELDIPNAKRVEAAEKEWLNKEGKAATVEGKSREEHCPALRSCPVYKEEYCEANYEQCARYKIISSALNSKNIPTILLPNEVEKAEAILENNL